MNFQKVSTNLKGSVRFMRNVLMFKSFRWLSLLPPSPGSTSYASFRHSNVASDIWTRLQNWKKRRLYDEKKVMHRKTYPGMPPDSMWLAIMTSFDHTSKCHFLLPRTPHITDPLWIPIRISKSTWEVAKQILLFYFVVLALMRRGGCEFP